jgi:hypothetical protein
MDSIIILAVIVIVVILVLMLAKPVYAKLVGFKTESKPDTVEFMYVPLCQSVTIGNFRIRVSYDMSSNLRAVHIIMGETQINIQNTAQCITIQGSSYSVDKKVSPCLRIFLFLFNDMVYNEIARDALLLKKCLTAAHDDELTCSRLLTQIVDELIKFGTENYRD